MEDEVQQLKGDVEGVIHETSFCGHHQGPGHMPQIHRNL
jgi:hypothetical protein